VLRTKSQDARVKTKVLIPDSFLLVLSSVTKKASGN
jgi:hypothetical protein